MNYVRRVDGIGYDGGVGLRLAPPPAEPTPAREEAVVQSIDITPGLCAARIRYRVTSPDAAEGQLSLRLQLLNASGSAIYTYQQPLILVSEFVEEWTYVSVCEDIPSEVNGIAVAGVKFIASLLKFDGNGEVHLDDAEVFAEQPLPAGATDPAVTLEIGELSEPGASTEATVTVTAADLVDFAGDVRIALPEGWSAQPDSIAVSLAPGSSRTVPITIHTAPTAEAGQLHQVIVTAGPTRVVDVVPIGEPAANAVQIVDTTSNRYEETGAWARSTLAGHSGGATRYARPGNGASASWGCDLTEDGFYRLSVWYPAYGLNTRSAAYRLEPDDEPIRLDQTIGSQWRVLDWRDLAVGPLTISVTGEDDRDLRADAIRVERVVPAVEVADQGTP